MRKALLVVLFLSMIVMASSAQSTPKVALSATGFRLLDTSGSRGSGFPPRRNISAHLQTPDGKEYPVLPMVADTHGEFSHDIDTLLLAFGTHELWVVDGTSKISSDHVSSKVIADFVIKGTEPWLSCCFRIQGFGN